MRSRLIGMAASVLQASNPQKIKRRYELAV